MESAVTKLLVSTRQLLSALTDWSLGKVDEVDVSDFYVRLGNDFNTAVSAFSDLGIPMDDLLAVPSQLRHCLERCINQDPSPQNLERHLPEIRQTIVSLLQGLKNKQAQYKTRKDEEKRARVAAVERERLYQQAPRPIEKELPKQDERDDRWVPPRTQPRFQPSHQSSTSSSRSLPLPEIPQRTSSKPLPHPRSSFDIPSHPSSSSLHSFHSTPPNRPPSPSNQSEASSIHSQPSKRPHRSNRHREGPLPAPPPDAFKPSRPTRAPSVGIEDGPRASVYSPETNPSPPVRTTRSSHRSSNSGSTFLTFTDPAQARMRSPSKEGDGEGIERELPNGPVVRHSLSEPSTEPIAPSPTPSSSIPLPPLTMLAPVVEPPVPTTPPRPSIADQTLWNLRGSGNGISRRASQRYSSYQINKFMDVGEVGSSGGVKAKSSRRLSGITDGSVGDVKISPSRSRGAGAGRHPPPVPALPEGMSALGMGEGFVPPLQDGGIEVRVEAEEEEEEQEEVKARSTSPVVGRPLVRSSSAFLSPNKSLAPSLSSLSEENDTPSSTPGPRPPTLTIPSEPTPAEDRSPESVTVFLLYNRECKKVLAPANPTIPALRMLFMEKFAYNAVESDEFPAIYVQDPRTDWRYEWEEGEGLAEGVRLSLNVEPLDQVKLHIDNQLNGLSEKLAILIRESVGPLSSQFATLQAATASSRRLSAQLTLSPTASPHLRPSASPVRPAPGLEGLFSKVVRNVLHSETPAPSEPTPTPVPAPPLIPSVLPPTDHKILRSHLVEIEALRRDLGVIRQVHADGMGAIQEVFQRIRKETQRLRTVATGSIHSGRSFVNASKAKIDEQSQETLRRMEDLQDVVEELYQDVTEKMIVPKPGLMRSLKADLDEAEGRLKELQQTTKASTTTWRSTWAEEMENVMAEEKQLKYHVALTRDIEADYLECKRVFDQITLYAAQRSTTGPAARPGFLRPTGGGEDRESTLSTVLVEIKGATIDPERRLQAIENAARMRQREQAGRKEGDVLASQLSDFVEGRKLRKTGGVQETERLRQRKNELALRAAGGLPSPSANKSSSSLTPVGVEPLKSVEDVGVPPLETVLSPLVGV